MSIKTSTCTCGVMAVLDSYQGILQDCFCPNRPNPWHNVPEGTLVVWEEVRLRL